jgi:hypothetical protein
MGFSLLPEELLLTDKVFNEKERDELRLSMRHKVHELMGKGRLSAPLIRRTIVAYEHHIPYRNPVTQQINKIHPFARIVAVADAYDSLTTKRPWREAYPPDEALRLLVKNEGQRFDPTVVKVLVNLLGMFPLGTVVRLGSGEYGIVYHNSNEAKYFEKPWVKIVRDASGAEVKKTLIRNLSQESGPESEIVATAHAGELGGIDPGMAILL